VAEPLWAGGSARFRAGPDGRPARSGGWLSPIGGVAQPDLAGGSDRLGGWLSPIWPVAGRVAGGSATHQIGLRPPLTGHRFLLCLYGLRCVQRRPDCEYPTRFPFQLLYPFEGHSERYHPSENSVVDDRLFHLWKEKIGRPRVDITDTG
jgi:hypothetical protein